MTRAKKWEKRLPATPYPGANVVPWPVGEPAPRLPAGAAGISVWIRTRNSDPARMAGPNMIGVDDRPMWHGVGRAVVVVEPGQHLVEVRGRFSAESVRRVRVAAHEIAEFEYWTPRSTLDGVLVPPPARGRAGIGLWAFPIMFLPLTGIAYLGGAFDADSTGAFYPAAPAMLVVPPLLAFLTSRGKRWLDRRYRVRQSYEAAEADARVADTGAFLGDGPPPAGLADQTRGALVVVGTLWRDYVWNNVTLLNYPYSDPNGWQPWPVLAIDGVRRPFSWRSWCYRLPPGRHEVTVTLPPPGDGTAAAVDGGPAVQTPTSTVAVEIVAGAVTSLELRVKSRIEVRTIERRRDSPTVVVGYRAEVKPKISAAR